jgi:starvation-inducible outer membrane lipoprotein
MKLATRIVLAFVLALILTGCVVIVKSVNGNYNRIAKDYDDSRIDLEQEYKYHKEGR